MSGKISGVLEAEVNLKARASFTLRSRLAGESREVDSGVARPLEGGGDFSCN